MNTRESLNTIFIFDVGDIVMPALRHQEHDRHHGMIVERRIIDRGPLAMAVPEYMVRWCTPAGSIESDCIAHSEFELHPAKERP